MDEEAPTVRELVTLARVGPESAFVGRFGQFALVGPAAEHVSDAPGFRYATEHGKRPGGAHPMASLLESVVYGLTKRAGSPFPSVLVIGRAPNSDVWIDDARISKLHARVTLDAAQTYLLSDAGSANGTFVDDVRLGEREERPLVEGTRVSFGDRAFVVRGVATLHAMLRRFPKPA